MQTDEELMLSYQAGQRQAFEILAKRYWKPAFGFIRRLVKQDALAEDVLSKTFLKLHGAAPSYQPTARFSTFLFTIAYRESMSALRSLQRQGIQLPLESVQVGQASTHLMSEVPSPEQALVQKQAMARIDRTLELLPAMQRAAFVLFYREGQSVQQIAEALELQPGSVRAYLTHARATLRQELLGQELMAAEHLTPVSGLRQEVKKP